jgi:hypothetical protein
MQSYVEFLLRWRREGEKREKLLFRETTGSSTIFSLYETTRP